jgi:hypothetical protein
MMSVDEKETALWSKNASFPAIEKAKQRFLERQQVNFISRPNLSFSNSVSELRKDQETPVTLLQTAVANDTICFSKTTKMILQLCESFDQDLLFIDKQVTHTNRKCRKHYHQLVQDLDTCTTSFLEGQRNFKTIKPIRISISLKPKRQHSQRQKSRKNITDYLNNQVSNSIINRGAPKMTGRPINHSQQSEVDTIALKNHAAMILQCCFRRFLYRKLYVGGLHQWRQAQELALQSTKRLFWVQWRRFRYQKQRKRVLYERRIRSWFDSEQRYRWSREKAQEVVSIDGKYAMAKVYHTKRQLVSYWCLWLQYLHTKKRSNNIL